MTSAFSLVMRHFTAMWLLTAVGLWVGTLLPPSWMTPIAIVTLVLLIITIFVRKIRLLNFLLYCIPLLIGITLFWSTQFYIAELGETLVFGVFIGTVLLFSVFGIFGWLLPNMSGFGNYLFGALVVVLVFSVLFMFVPTSNFVLLLLAAVAALIFALYTIYDFNQLRHQQIERDEAVSYALNLYLDFINLFVRILEVIWRLKD